MTGTLEQRTPSQLAKGSAIINEMERILANHPNAMRESPPVVHRFTPGLYSRQITMPAGLVCTSKIHKTEHQYIVNRGLVRVWSEEIGWVEIRGPYHGITKPGARRILAVAEETVWTTFHPTSKTDLVELESELIEPHDIPLEELA